MECLFKKYQVRISWVDGLQILRIWCSREEGQLLSCAGIRFGFRRVIHTAPMTLLKTVIPVIEISVKDIEITHSLPPYEVGYI